MKIIKRNNTKQNFAPNKILTRLKQQSKGLNIDADKLFKKVIPHIVDGITTTEIDEVIAYQCADMQMEHPDYSLLGGRILLSRQSKLIGVEMKDVDYNYNFFSAMTFLTKYSKKDENKKPTEIPSMMYDRVSSHLYEEGKDRKELLKELESKKVNFATPILTNSGVDKRNGLISCNLTTLAGDSREDILETLDKLSAASKEGSGIGLCIDKLRSESSLVSSFNGNAGGVVRLADAVQGIMRFFKQGNRSGSCALYLSVWHKDISKFLELKLPTGEEYLRTRDLFLAVTIDDVFMDCLLNNKDYYLFCPNDIEKAGLKPLYEVWGEDFKEVYEKAVELGLGEKVDPQSIWDAIIKSQAESGVPYTFYKDNANKNNMQRNIGIINQSNLCVHPDTEVLTDKGYKRIGNGGTHTIWNGFEWSENVEFVKTNENQKLLKVEFSNGSSIRCTPHHKFYLQRGYTREGKVEKVEAKTLLKGDKLIRYHFSNVERGVDPIKYAYTQGFYCGDGCNPNDELEANHHISLYGKKKKLVSYLDFRNKIKSSYKGKIDYSDELALTENGLKLVGYLPKDIEKDKYFVPKINHRLEDTLKWFSGLSDADGCITNNKTSQSLQIASTNRTWLLEIAKMLHTLGCEPKVLEAMDEGMRKLPKNDGTGEYGEYFCKKSSRLVVNGNDLYNLHKLGLTFNRLKYTPKKPDRICSQFIKVVSISEVEGLYDTYCFTEPKRNMGIFNGILAGNCIEIMQSSKPEYTPQCTLASINLAEQDSLKSIAKSARILTRALNKVIDINKWSDEWSKKAGEDQRAIAIGVAGLADFFAKRKISFESEEAKEWNKKIFQTMYKAAVSESNKLALEQGRTYPAWKGSPYSKGETYIKGWNPLGEGEPIPVINSLFLGLMPTASSAILLGSFEMFEPITSNLFNRTVGGGEFLIINEYLVRELTDLNLWTDEVRDLIIKNEGSIQDIREIPEDIRYRYKTIWEISQKTLLDLAVVRNEFVDQSQSMNIYHKEAKYSKISSALVYAWKQGLKTGSYYTRVKAKIGKNKKLSVSSNEEVKPVKPENSMFSCAGGGCDT